MLTGDQRKGLIWGLTAASITLGVILVVFTAWLFIPLLMATAVRPPQETTAELPPLDVQPWHSLPVMHQGRVKPFESAARETVLKITGRSKFEGLDPVALVLTWRLLKGTNAGPGKVDWVNYPFILCDHQGLRQLLYDDKLEREKAGEQRLTPASWVLGKYVAPSDLYLSSNFLRLCTEVAQLHKDEGEKAQHAMSPEQRKAEEVEGRLIAFLGVTQNLPQDFPSELRLQEAPADPFDFVALDRVKGGGWFSLAELRTSRAKPEQWTEVMHDRLRKTPTRYIPPDCREDLEKFQAALKAGTAAAALDDLQGQLADRDQELVEGFLKRHGGKGPITLQALEGEPIFTDFSREEFTRLRSALDDKDEFDLEKLAKAVAAIFAERREQGVEDLRHQVASLKNVHYHPDDARFRMLHLNYLETRFPDIYRRSQAWQQFPTAQADEVLAGYAKVEAGYLKGDAATFTDASTQFFATVRDVSSQFDDYPGVPTLGLEMNFNHVQPFLWGWIIMLGAVVLFIVHLMVKWRPLYVLAFVVYLASLAFQVFGFYARISISGRPPVSDMYETVIWVSFMSAIFALVLELIYRRSVIGLAGALVATLGLILADHTVLDPTLQPLQPVLRSNFWLTIHVITIVSSYAGGTLAWGLANVALALLAFGKPNRELLKTLSQFTYRGMQIAVLLLAVGTFLGAWWANDSWGRYWGWDPKEVWALIALVAYVIPLHMRYIGWVKDFGLAVSAVVCYAAIVMSWYGVNFVLGAGLHSYGFGGGGPYWVFWAGLLNMLWVLIASILYLRKTETLQERARTLDVPPVPSPVPSDEAFVAHV